MGPIDVYLVRYIVFSICSQDSIAPNGRNLNAHFSLSIFITFFFPFSDSQFEGKFEEMGGAETPRKLPPPSNSCSVDCSTAPCVPEESRGNGMELDTQQNERIWSDMNFSHDYSGGMMKIVPSEIDVSVLWTMRKCHSSLSYVCMYIWISFRQKFVFDPPLCLISIEVNCTRTSKLSSTAQTISDLSCLLLYLCFCPLIYKLSR